MPENFEFLWPWAFTLLPLPFLIRWLIPSIRLRSDAIRWPNLEGASNVTKEPKRVSAGIKSKPWYFTLSLYVSWIFFVGALAGPQLVQEPEMVVKTSRNFLIAADLSFSMAKKDWEVNGEKKRRWDAVKSLMHQFIAEREGDRMGLILFGSDSYIQAPFTTDLETVDILLEEADVGMAGQMTHIGKAVSMGIDMLDRDTLESKVLLLLTDGVDAGTDIQPLDAARQAQNDSVIIYAIGIGSADSRNSDLDEATLKSMAEMTNGQYFLASETDELAKVYEELDALEPIEYEEEENTPVQLLYMHPLSWSLIALLLGSVVNGLISLFVDLQKRASHE